MKLLILLLFSPLVFAQSNIPSIRPLDPTHQYLVGMGVIGLSVYDDYNDKSCTQPLLDDGVCPDHLQGGCALIGECELILERREKEARRRRE